MVSAGGALNAICRNLCPSDAISWKVQDRKAWYHERVFSALGNPLHLKVLSAWHRPLNCAVPLATVQAIRGFKAIGERWRPSRPSRAESRKSDDRIM